MAITDVEELSTFARIVYTRYTATPPTVTLAQVTALKTNGKLTTDEFNFITGN